MKSRNDLLIGMVLLAMSASVFAQATKPAATMTEILDKSIGNMENELTSAAEAMPEDKYSFVPTTGEFKGVRNFGVQVRHVAAVNYMVAASILGEKAPATIGGENGPDSMTRKTDIVKFLKDSFAYVHKAVGTINDANSTGSIKSPFGDDTTTRLNMAVLLVGHGFDHYGQVVEYLRLNGIIPPASRQ